MKQRSRELGNKNIIGANITKIRKGRGLKHKEFLAKLQVRGLNISSTALTRLEGQDRYAKDYEIYAVAEALA